MVVVDQAAIRRACGAPVSSRGMTLGFGEQKSFGLAPATRPCRGVRVTRISALRVFVAKPLLIFLRKHVWQRGLLEGTHGIIRCAMAGFVGFVNYVRFRELTGDRAG